MAPADVKRSQLHGSVSSRGLRVTFLTHYFPPERGAPQTRLNEIAHQMRNRGVDVSVVTGPPHYPTGRVAAGYSPFWPSRRTESDLEVIRLPMLPRPNRGFFDRMIDQSSFALTALAAAPVVARSDAFIVESPPLFLGGTAAVLGRVTARPYIFHVADPWPDFPIEMGALRDRRAIAAARWLEMTAYRHAALITTVTPPLVRRLDSKAGATGKVRLLLNAVDVDRFDPAADAGDARRKLGWRERPTLVYVGTVGLAQGLGTLVDAVAQLPQALDLQVKVVGEGAEAESLAALAAARELDRIEFLPPVSADRVPALLAAGDGTVVLLRGGRLHAESLPTKLVEGLAAGRPIVLSADGYPADLVNDAGAGITAPAEDSTALASAMVRVSLEPDLSIMRSAARRAAQGFTREAATTRLLEYVNAVVSGGRGG